MRDDTASGFGPSGLMAAPAGFTGPAAVQAWRWLTTAAPAPRVLVCGAGGGVGVTTVVATLAGLLAAARPDRVVAVEVARRDYSPLTRQVCGPVDPVTAGTWLTDHGDRVPDLAELPAGPSGARVVQAGAHWWPRLTEQLTADTAVVADLGSIDHADTRTLLLAHRGPAVMVARADSAGVTAALAALTALDAAGLPHRPVLVLCDAAGSRPGVLRTAQRLAATAADVLILPKAPVLRRSPIPIGGWDRALSNALADLTCALARPDRTDPAPAHVRRPLPIADDTDSATSDTDPTTAPTTDSTTDEEMP
jgi:MinD-like ATPase involved in chromosome partitioning or flagellar assembly